MMTTYLKAEQKKQQLRKSSEFNKKSVSKHCLKQMKLL